jgi:hypothetical protein
MAMLFHTRQGPPGERGRDGARGPAGSQGQLPDAGTETRVFEGSMVEPGDTADHVIYSLPSHRGVVIDLCVLAHDLNSNTNYVYMDCRDYWTRQWTDAPQRIVLRDAITHGTGTLEVTYAARDHDMVVTMTHGVAYATNVSYKVVATLMVVG